MKKILSYINYWIEILFGLKVVRSKELNPINLSSFSDPRISLYKAFKTPKAFLCLPFSKGKLNWWFDIKPNSKDPYIYSLTKSEDAKEKIFSLEQTLTLFRETVNCDDANQYWGISEKFSVFPIDEHPCRFVFPWQDICPEKQFEIRMKNVFSENMRFGLNSCDYLTSSCCGSEKVKVEAQRLFSLYNSIKKKGYFFSGKSRDAITVSVLIAGSEWRWLVLGGHHRIAVLCSVGEKVAPVLIDQIVRIEDVEFWPGVVNGLYTKEAAIDLFYRLFNGVIPVIYKNWMQI